MRPGQAERHTHDYQRHGTTSLFAALDVKAGTIIGKCMARHRAQEFRRFLDTVEQHVPADLDIHIVMDNASSHKTKLIRDWFAKRLCWHMHFTPTSSSWINQVERFFALLTDQQIKRGAHRGARNFDVLNVPDLGLAPALRAQGPTLAAEASIFTAGFDAFLQQTLAGLARSDGLDLHLIDSYALVHEAVAD